MKRSVKHFVKSRWAIENTPHTALLLALLVVLTLAPATPAVACNGIADCPLPTLLAGKKTLHLYSVPGVINGDLITFFACTSTETTKTIQVGIEVFDFLSGPPFNDAVSTSLAVGPGATVTFGTHPHNTTPFVMSDLLLPSPLFGAARILATSNKLICTAFLLEPSNDPPASMVYLTIVKKLVQKGE